MLSALVFYSKITVAIVATSSTPESQFHMGDETSSEPLSPTSTENVMHYHDEDLDILNLESVQRDSIGFEKEASYNFHNVPVDDGKDIVLYLK